MKALKITIAAVICSLALVGGPSAVAYNVDASLEDQAVRCYDLLHKDQLELFQSLFESIRNSIKTGKKKNEKAELVMLVNVRRVLDYTTNVVMAPDMLKKLKTYAVRKHLKDEQIREINTFYNSPLGIKTLKFQELNDSLDDQQEALRIADFTLNEIELLQKQFESGVVYTLQQSSNGVSRAFIDTLQSMVQTQGDIGSKRAQNDLFGFFFNSPFDKEQELSKEEQIKREIEALKEELQNRERELNPEVPKYSQKEIQRMVAIATAIHLDNDPKPCDQYVCKWGVGVNEVRKAASGLGMTFVKDSSDADGVILVYAECFLYVHPKRGFYRIGVKRSAQSKSIEDFYMRKSFDEINAKMFTDAWTVIDSETLAGFGKCEDAPDRAIIHGIVRAKGHKWRFVECVELPKN